MASGKWCHRRSGELTWGMTIANFGEVRYTIRLDAEGCWLETGEVTQNGKSRRFFEMTLKRAAAP